MLSGAAINFSAEKQAEERRLKHSTGNRLNLSEPQNSKVVIESGDLEEDG
jgi:hypothetical protein